MVRSQNANVHGSIRRCRNFPTIFHGGRFRREATARGILLPHSNASAAEKRGRVPFFETDRTEKEKVPVPFLPHPSGFQRTPRLQRACLHPDGRRFVVVRQTASSNQLNVVLNFFDVIEDRVPAP